MSLRDVFYQDILSITLTQPNGMPNESIGELKYNLIPLHLLELFFSLGILGQLSLLFCTLCCSGFGVKLQWQDISQPHSFRPFYPQINKKQNVENMAFVSTAALRFLLAV